MKRTIAAICLLAVPFTASCTSSITFAQTVGTDSYEVLRVEAQDGSREIYTVRDGRSLRLTTEYTRERPFLGFQVQELTKFRADQRGVDPHIGLLVNGTYADSSARLAGVVQGDVLLSVDGKPVTNVDQLAEVEKALADQQEIPFRILRGQQEQRRTMRANLLREDVRDVQAIHLEPPSPLPRPFAGVNLGGIPKTWAERMFGEGKNGVVVSEVTVGSPAWLGGVRGGDLIVAVDGEPVPPVDELADRIRASGEAGKSMTWRVRREVGRTYDAEIHLEDFSGSSRIHIPILFHAASDVHEDVWRIGWGLIAGNRNRYVADQTTRVAQTKNTFSALLGLIRVSTDPRETSVRLLWFIHFET